MPKASYRLTELPSVENLKTLCQSLAMLDAIIYPEWEGRYYSFNNHWSSDIALASMRDGEGDHWFILFASPGSLIKGFAHESVMSPYRIQPPSVWPGVLDSLPETLKSLLADPALLMEDVTFCFWRTSQDIAWTRGNVVYPPGEDRDGSLDLLTLLDGNPESYQKWATEYYEREVDLDAVRHVYEHNSLTPSVLAALNPNLTLADLSEDIEEIGFNK